MFCTQRLESITTEFKLISLKNMNIWMNKRSLQIFLMEKEKVNIGLIKIRNFLTLQLKNNKMDECKSSV